MKRMVKIIIVLILTGLAIWGLITLGEKYNIRIPGLSNGLKRIEATVEDETQKNIEKINKTLSINRQIRKTLKSLKTQRQIRNAQKSLKVLKNLKNVKEIDKAQEASKDVKEILESGGEKDESDEQ